MYIVKLKKYLLLILVVILIGALVFCIFELIITSHLLGIEKSKVDKLETEIKNDYFSKKVECDKYRTSIDKMIKEYNENPFSQGGNTLEALFYSSKDNSCLYVTESLNSESNREYHIFNALTNTNITSFRFPEQWDDYKKFMLEYSNGEIRL